MECINGKCKKTQILFNISKENAIVPGEVQQEELRTLLSYFQYRAPNIESEKSEILEEIYHAIVLQKIVGVNKNFIFCAQNSNIESEYSQLALSGLSICSGCHRFVCKRSKQKSNRVLNQKESDLECLLRHLRNSLAHGHVYFAKKEIFSTNGKDAISEKTSERTFKEIITGILFEDINPNTQKSSARIVCRQIDLKNWRHYLEDALREQKEKSKSQITSSK